MATEEVAVVVCRTGSYTQPQYSVDVAVVAPAAVDCMYWM